MEGEAPTTVNPLLLDRERLIAFDLNPMEENKAEVLDKVVDLVLCPTQPRPLATVEKCL